MHNRYQQHFYRAAFFLLCLAPTAYTIGYIVERRVSAAGAVVHAEIDLSTAEADLARILGVRVSLEDMEYVGEHVTRLSGLELHDPETDALLATVESLDMYYADGGALAIEPAGVTLVAGELPRLATILHGRVLREMPSSLRIEAECGMVQLVGGPREETVSHVSISIAHAEHGRTASIQFRPAWAPQSGLLRVDLIRSVTEPRPTTSIAFHTGAESLPASWFAATLPAVAELGDACQLQGSIAARETPAGWETTFAGTLSRLELDRLLAPSLRRHAMGTAQLKIDRARWRGGQLAEAEGWVGADALPVSIRLAEALTALGLVPQEPLSRGEALQSGMIADHGQLACRFTLDRHGLLLRGDQGVVLRDGQTPLLAEPQSLVSWTPRMATLCGDLGLPPLDMLPAGPPSEPAAVRLLRGAR